MQQQYRSHLSADVPFGGAGESPTTGTIMSLISTVKGTPPRMAMKREIFHRPASAPDPNSRTAAFPVL
jgi:hypothetical protein